MDLGLHGKTALVFGAGGGLGGAIARSLAQEGAQLALADINGEAVEQLGEELRQAGTKVVCLEWDLGDLSLIDTHITHIEQELGGIDILLNNTGGPPPTSAAGQDATTWMKYFQSMVVSVIAVTDRVLPGMRDRGFGRIVTSSSSGVLAPIPNLGISNTLRASLMTWSKTLAREVAKDGVTCNLIIPGRVATARVRFLDEQRAQRENRSVAQIAAESAATIPMQRYGEPQEFADVATFIASERASYITGSVIRVDGGLIAGV
ncbi:SDR family oxidoreductase [Alcaligenes endophyticus]|uniref:SDR family oxidoreductase n=1 Tax=Alcaligenes endophyticus TaxID=1929088 RepID=A0ABT8EN72_9BURK|nr:SDR family oxidoreductase [Alcaligenes endophyticus]MCX5591401.1 SDR family oxidoreductase [Alcaligenes endophyticus]MDN4122718.1 SDR family oxidoreductase [Alcaligenes endophyticus]